jgi:putative ABC transport system permease protein
MSRVRRLLTGEAGPGPALALAVIALLGAFLATAGPREVTALQNSALRQTLASAGAFGISAEDDWQLSGGAPMAAGQIQTMGGAMGGFIRPPLVSPAAQRWAGLTMPFLPVLNPQPGAILGGPPTVEVAYRSTLARHARLISGSLPGVATVSGRQTVVQAAVTAATAARFGLRPGSRVRLGRLPTMPASDPSVVLSVTGVLHPAGPSSPFWTRDPALAAPVTLKAGGTTIWAAGFFFGPDELAAVQSAYSGAIATITWDYPVRTTGLTAAGAPGMLAAMTGLTSGNAGEMALQATTSPLESPPTLAADGAGTLSGFIAAQAAVGSTDALLLAGVAAATAILLLVGAVVLTGAHRPELTLIRARGGSTGQVAARIAAITAGAAGPALVAGVAAGVAAVPDGGNTTSWVLAALVAVIALAAPALLAAREHRGLRSLTGSGRGDLVIPRHSARRLVVEIGAAIAIVGAVVALRSRGLAPGAGVDPYLVLAPAGVAVAAGLIAARVYPVPLRALLRVTAAGRGTVGYLGIARSARARSVPLLPALALVVAMAVIALGGMVRAAVSAGQVAASWQQVGADAVVAAAGSQTSIGPGAQAKIAAAPGVRRADAAYVVAPGSTGQGDLLVASGGGVPVGVVVADPARYAALVADTPWPAFPARALAPPGHGGAAGGTVPVIASPGVAADIGTGARQLAFASSQLPVRVAATASSTPALPGGGNFVIIPAWASSRLAASTAPNTMLLSGGAINLRALAAVVARELPGGQVVSRAAALQATAGTPAVHGADLAFDLSAGAAAACGAAAVLFGMLLAGRDRTRTGVWLTAMGMTAGQARRLAVLDALPLLLIAILGGELAGLVLGPLIGPGLDLSAFTGSNAPVPVRPDLVALIAPAAGAVLLIMAAAVVQNALIRSRAAAVLRLDEGR